ncbi:MAG TPA: NlpC/P60 family protein [Micromonosporaceae bacterium]|nr:NlpC/P60 family protein [Micromonosporaceae bacterium]
MASARGLTATMARAAVATATACLVLVASTSAYAAPTPAEVEAQIDAAWEHLEPVIEQYNAVRVELKASQGKAAELQAKMAPLQLQVDLALDRVSDIAVRAYMGGSTTTLNAMLSGGSPATLADQLSLLNQLARADRDRIQAVTQTRDTYTKEKVALDALVGKLAAQDAELAGKKQEIEKKINDLEKMRQQASRSAGPGVAPAKPPTNNTPCPLQAGSGAAAVAVAKACDQLGKPYYWGAEGPNSFDCSGLTMFAWKAAGRSLPHNAKAQYNSMPHVTRAQLRPGDLVFSYSDLHHVGLYIGGGYVVHAPRSGKTVEVTPADRPGTPQFYGRPG